MNIKGRYKKKKKFQTQDGKEVMEKNRAAFILATHLL